MTKYSGGDEFNCCSLCCCCSCFCCWTRTNCRAWANASSAVLLALTDAKSITEPPSNLRPPLTPNDVVVVVDDDDVVVVVEDDEIGFR